MPTAEGRKQAVSLRVSSGDLRKVKRLAQRLGVRDTDVIRFALKTMLARVAPLCDHSVRGRDLVSVLIEAGSDLFHHFDLDTARLEEIVNDGASKDQEVDADDLQRIALASVQHTHANLRLNQVTRVVDRERRAADVEDPLNGRLRSYLYSKYVDAEATLDASVK